MPFSLYTFYLQENGLLESNTQLLIKLRKFSTGFLKLKKFSNVDVFKNSIYLCTKCHVCDVGYRLTV